jgi:hypothetical protein
VLEAQALFRWAVLALEQRVGEAGLQLEERAPRGLRGVRGQDRPHLELAQVVPHFRGGAIVAAELLERPANARGLRGELCALFVAVTAAHAVHLLGGVDEEEEEREGARDGRRHFDREIRHAREQRVEIGRGGFTAPPTAARGTQIFHCLEDHVALQPLDDLPERGSEPAHVLLQGPILGANFGVRCCGAHGLCFARRRDRRKPLCDADARRNTGVWARVSRVLPEVARSEHGSRASPACG